MPKDFDSYEALQPNLRSHAAAAVERIVTEIVSRIEKGDWLAGHKLPTERDLELRFGVARNTLRKGLKILEARGLIIRRVGSGSFVARAERPTLPDANFLNGALGASPSEVLEVRMQLEPWGAALAARRASAADLQHLRECLAASESARDYKRFEYWDGQLHASLIAAAKNEMLTGLQAVIDAARLQPEWVALKKRAGNVSNRNMYESQHRVIVEAVSNRDPDGAKAAVEEHLRQVRRVMLGD